MSLRVSGTRLWTCWWHPRGGEGFSGKSLPVGEGATAGEAIWDALRRRPFLPPCDLVARGPEGEEAVASVPDPSPEPFPDPLPEPLPAVQGPADTPEEAPGEATPSPLPPRRRNRGIRTPRALRERRELVPWYLDPERKARCRERKREAWRARMAKRAPPLPKETPVSGTEEPAKVSAPGM